MQARNSDTPVVYDWRHLLANGLYKSGVLGALRRLSQYWEVSFEDGAERLRKVQRSKYVVLGYHNVGSRGLPLYSRLPRSVFAEQMRYIKQNYRVLSLRQMLAELENPAGQGQGVVVTFDDGYVGTYREAFPVLKQYGIPASIYLAAGAIESGEVPWYDRIFLQIQRAPAEMTVHLDTERVLQLTTFASRVDAATEIVLYLRTRQDEERRSWCKWLDERIPLPEAELQGSMMNWEQIREMLSAGISFGCHTMTHPVLSRLTPDSVQREVAESKFLIENRLDVHVEDFAFPFGKARDCGTVGAQELSQLGIKTAMTTIVGVNERGANHFRLRRMVQGDECSIAMFAYRLQRLFFRPEDEEINTASRSAPAN